MKKIISALWLAAAVVAGVAGSASAHDITLQTTIRDFRKYHIDFETTIADDRNYVSSTLGLDGKPDYIGGMGTATTHGAVAYNTWYNDVPGINMSTMYDLVLSNNQEARGGLYTFSDTTFFPIDNQLFGNEGNSHNYHFTLELHTQFVYQPGLFLNVTADDDLLVFINDQRVIDLGGIHPPQNASATLDSLGLAPGITYDFELFFAERHKVQSNLTFSTNIQFVPEPGTMIVLIMGAVSLAVRRRR